MMGKISGKKNYKRNTLIVCIMLLLACVIPTHISYAAEPKVMLTAYKIKEGNVKVGEEFNIELTIKNTAQKAVSNLKIIVNSDNGEFVPVNSTGTDYIDYLEGGEEYTFNFKLQAVSSLLEQSYGLHVKYEYEDKSGYNSYEAEDIIYIPVIMEQRASVSGVYITSDSVLGDSVELIGTVNNMGIGTLYNVMAYLDSQYLGKSDCYIGNIEPGKKGSINIVASAVKTTMGEELENLKVTYEDKLGNVYELDSKFQFEIIAPDYSNVEMIKNDAPKHNTGLIIKLMACIIVVALIVVYFLKKQKRKKAILEEF